MFQKAIKEEFSKFDFTNVNNKNEIKEIISCNVHVMFMYLITVMLILFFMFLMMKDIKKH